MTFIKTILFAAFFVAVSAQFAFPGLPGNFTIPEFPTGGATEAPGNAETPAATEAPVAESAGRLHYAMNSKRSNEAGSKSHE